MSKKNNSNGNGSGSGSLNGNSNEGSKSRKAGLEVDGVEEQQRVTAGDSGSSGSSGGPSSSMNPSPISPSAADTTAAGQGAVSISASTSTNGAKPARKGKAVQWLDHHLNSQAAQAQAQAHAQHHDIDLNDPPASVTIGLGLIVDGSLIDNQTSAQASDQLKQLKDQEQRRLKEQQSELEGLKTRETQLEKILEDNGHRSWSPHALDEKGIDPNPFIELTTALERHQSQSLPRAGDSNFSLTLPQMPPSAYPQSDSATTEKSKATAPAPSVPNPPPLPVPRVHYFPPPRPRAGMTPVHLPPIETHALKDFSQSTRGVDSSPTDTSFPTPNRPVSGISGSQTPATASTTAESSPDTAMRHAMLPIVPGEDLHPSMTGPGSNTGIKGFWANIRQRTSMRRTNNVPGAFIYTGENAGLPSRGRPIEGNGGDDAEGEDAVRKGEVEVHPEDVEAYAKSRAKQIVRAHTRSSKKKKFPRVRRTRDLTDTDGDFTDEDGEQKKRRGPLFPSWGYKGTKSKDYGNADIDKLGWVAAESDVEKDADNSSLNSSFMAPPSGGVLGALLTLYNAQNDTASDSIPPSGASTPTIQDEPTSNGRERKEPRRARPNRAVFDETSKIELEPPLLHLKYSPSRLEVIDTDEARSIPQTQRLDDNNDLDQTISSPTFPSLSSSPTDEFRANAMSKRGVTSTARKLLRMHTQRPPQARNAGGVFGSLIASTGNITGAAAPTPSTLAPNVDRPGFNLTRYGYKDDHLENKAAVNPSPSIRGHHPGAKSLGHVELDNGPSFDGSTLARISTAPAESGPGLAVSDSFFTSSSNAHSESASPSTASANAFADQYPHLMARTPVSAYIPAPTDYFSPQHGSSELTPGPLPLFQGERDMHPKPLLSTRLEPTTPGGTPISSIAKRAKWTGVLKDFPGTTGIHLPYTRSGKSTPATPGSITTSERDWYDSVYSEKENREEREKREKRERDKKERKKRKKAELFITRHVAQIIQRQEFICKLARSMMMFGGPAHRLTSQIQATARVLDIELSCMYLPDVMLISFEDSSTGTSLIKFIKQGSVLNIGKLGEGYMIYWKVIHDDLSVSDASAALDKLMRRPPQYKWWHLMLTGGFCSAAICTVSFAGSFIDSVAVFPLGAILVGIQLLSVRNELYSNVFEITIATVFSFICGGLAATKRICYSFGLAIGAEAYQTIVQTPIANLSDTTCALTHNAEGPWWQRTPSKFWAFLTVPLYSLVLSMRNHQPLLCKEMLICVIISCIGWVVTFFVGQHFQNQADFASAVGAFAIGMISNLAGRFLNGNAFTIMLTGILFQVPSGLGNNGLLVFVSQQTDDSGTDSEAYLSGFQTSLQLISVAIGLTIGLGIALFLSHPIPSRRRAGGVFSL
ncbi:DUF1212-domain-containing protein [Lentinula edodes]|uniref:DUF1212-domain-containing protein n=1 Tax=Lentinula edodes TaxID=5353 RepID=A0A1Q3EBT3_LENED|nr:DUF1212-domain-containing protein [Lentinula edodes]